jgi:tetratricopeptide (TPR) repeat protein
MLKSSSGLLVELLTRGIGHAADSQQGFVQLARKLLAIAETAYTCRDFATVKEASELLMALPVARAQSAGLWYQSVVTSLEGQPAAAFQSLRELIADPHAAPRFRGRAFQTIGVIHEDNGDFDAARELFAESARYIRRESPRDAYVFANAIILHSHTRGIEGDSRQALKELASINGLVEKLRHPQITAFYFNNIAVELLELGRLDEAAHYSRIACSSPLAFAYAACKETAFEIEQRAAKRNVIAVAASPEPRKRPAQPRYLLVVLRFSPCVRLAQPKRLRQRVSCKNPSTARVALVARIRAPSIHP